MRYEDCVRLRDGKLTRWKGNEGFVEKTTWTRKSVDTALSPLAEEDFEVMDAVLVFIVLWDVGWVWWVLSTWCW
jgi:hypothetical protein